ncbi:MAG: CPBP family intramembrane metalloprotease [Candidatus Abawacabacteria bacterium]|nr:CPBP family intramembrane metalloprotease [Candidatus Abawacabacteria bacterium]
MQKLKEILFGKNWLSFLFMLFSVVLLVNVIDLVRSVFWHIETPWLAFVWGYSLQTSIFLFTVYFWFFRRFPNERKRISFHNTGYFQLVGNVLLIFLCYFTFVGLLFSVAQYWGIDSIPGLSEQPSLLEPLGQGVGVIAALIIAIFIAPTVEEYIFRGWGMICLPVERYPYISFLANAIFFGLLHFQIGSIIPLLFLGFMLAWVRFRTNSLLPGIVFHVVNNCLAFIADYSMMNSK